MTPAEEYIKSLGENYLFSEILTTPSDGVTGVALSKRNNRGAVQILIHSINISVVNGAGFVQFTDPYGMVLIRVNQQLENSGQYIFPPYVYKGDELRITSSVRASNFNVVWQFMSVKKDTQK